MKKYYISNEGIIDFGKEIKGAINGIEEAAKNAYVKVATIVYDAKQLLSEINGAYNPDAIFNDLLGETLAPPSLNKVIYSSTEDTLSWLDLISQFNNLNNVIDPKSGVIIKGFNDLSSSIPADCENNPFISDILGLGKVGPLFGVGVIKGIDEKHVPIYNFSENKVISVEGPGVEKLVEFIKLYIDMLSDDSFLKITSVLTPDKCDDIIDKAIKNLPDERKKPMVEQLTVMLSTYINYMLDMRIQAGKAAHNLAIEIAELMHQSTDKKQQEVEENVVSEESLVNYHFLKDLNLLKR